VVELRNAVATSARLIPVAHGSDRVHRRRRRLSARVIELLVRIAGCSQETLASAREFLSWPRISSPNCLVCDVGLPDLNGLELRPLVADRHDMPIIFITGYSDVPRAMQAGATGFLIKPFSDEVLLNALRQAFERSDDALCHAAGNSLLQHR
jgi:FixJ family two-component response regulator